MKRRVFVQCGALAALLAAAGWAAGITGKWKAEFQTPDGNTRSSIFNLKEDGATLTGTVESPRGQSEIQEGRISGNEISFSVVRNFGGNDVKMLYKGTVSGDEMKLKVEVEGGDRTFEMTAKRM
ncbi:MAG: hypothetical protein IT158_13555 [Bryobacterales bacterium]|nr:hypothetical protein [Bryobacterales bacterium]